MTPDLLQVMSEPGGATATAAPPDLSDADLRKLYRVMVMTRLLDERAIKL